ncbi:MAG: AsmA family protein, partial [Gammaproteobacteria bacterium]|nr:AsmA family protein [Gammaproteobacteria bacterium]
MNEFFRTHTKAKWTGIVILGLLAAIVVFLSFFDWNALRPALAREITAKTGRPTSIDGDLRVHLWSWNPTAEVNGLTIRNPPWADRDLMFGAKRITISLSLGLLLRGQIVLPQITLLEPTINLERDAQGRASWELGTRTGTPNHDTQPAKLPTIRRLIVDDGKLHVVDQIRKLTFSGSLVAADQAGKQDAAAFKIRCAGSLNSKPFRLEADGGPLLDL